MRCIRLLLASVTSLLSACSTQQHASAVPTAPASTAPSSAPAEPAVEIHKAEYSLRWKPTSPLASVDDVVKWLGGRVQLSEPRADPSVDVRYFTPDAADHHPQPFRSILRRRGTSSWTYKVRGNDGAVPSREAALSGCDDAVIEGEWDISLDASGTVDKRTASISCDGEGSSGKPGSLMALARERPCLIQMERTRIEWSGHKDIKLEHWAFRPSRNAASTELLEISWKGKARANDEATFRALIKGIPIKLGEHVPSKEELAEACDVLVGAVPVTSP